MQYLKSRALASIEEAKKAVYTTASLTKIVIFNNCKDCYILSEPSKEDKYKT